MKRQGLFITGTGTDVGKTLVSAALSRALWQAKVTHIPIKPVQTGVSYATHSDAALYTAAHIGLDVPAGLHGKTLFSYAMAASPHLAAHKQGLNLTIQDILDALPTEKNPLLLEGAGGVCVPLNSSENSLDLMQVLGFPVLLVVRNTLGALNHALLSIDALQQRGLSLLAVICKDVDIPKDAQEATIRADNIHYLRNYLQKQGTTVCRLPHICTVDCAGFDILADSLRFVVDLCKQCWGKNFTPCSEDILQWDKEHLWHPYTSATQPLPSYEVTHAKGARLYLRDGRALIDGMSSWWCAAHGYGQAALVRAAKEQAERMAHVMFGGITHVPAVQAAKKLMALLPQASQQSLTRLFWADSGSVAVEVALKMALQYQQGVGAVGRTKILSPLGGYYGDTLGAMSVCDPVNGMHSLFNGVLPQHIFIERPSCTFNGKPHCPFDADSLQPLEAAFAAHGQELAACIIEPIVQGAGGMYFYHPLYLQKLRALCDAHGVLLILDEIATGFGRTGKMFAHEWCAEFGATVVPDILCVGKALTGGMLTLAATLCTEAVAEGICRNGGVFMHGPTFMANALACAVAAASLDIFADGAWQEQVLRIESELKQGLEPCGCSAAVQNVRVLGAIGVVEMRKPVDMAKLQAFFVEQGVWVRPFGKLVYIMPPYVSSSEDVATLCAAVRAAMEILDV